MGRFEKFVELLTWWTTYIGKVALFGAMAVVVTNIILRTFWRPLPGTVEITEMFGAVLLAMGIAYCALSDGHISVDVLFNKLSSKSRAIVELITNFISFVFLTALAGQTLVYATSLLTRGATTSHLTIPTYPIGYLVSLGFIMLALVLFLRFIQKIIILKKGSENQ